MNLRKAWGLAAAISLGVISEKTSMIKEIVTNLIKNCKPSGYWLFLIKSPDKWNHKMKHARWVIMTERKRLRVNRVLFLSKTDDKRRCFLIDLRLIMFSDEIWRIACLVPLIIAEYASRIKTTKYDKISW